MLSAQRVRFDKSTTVLHHGHLDDDGEDGDVDEQHVVENAAEHIDFSELKLSGVDLIEDLHEHESLEDVGVMDDLLGVVSVLHLAGHVLVLVVIENVISALELETQRLVKSGSSLI